MKCRTRWKNGQIEHYGHFNTSTFNKISSLTKWDSNNNSNESVFVSYLFYTTSGIEDIFSTFLALSLSSNAMLSRAITRLGHCMLHCIVDIRSDVPSNAARSRFRQVCYCSRTFLTEYQRLGF